MAIFSTVSLTPDEQAWLAAQVGEPVQFASNSNKDEQAFQQCDVLYGRVPQEWVQANSSLRWMQLSSVGFDDLLPWNWVILGKRLQVTNLAGYFANPVAETALAGLIAITRRIDELVRLQQQRVWKKMELRPQLRSLSDASVLLAGYGSIAQRFEELLAPFNPRITRFSRQQPLSNEDESLRQADVIFCSMPETPATRTWFNPSRLSKLKRNAIFMNVGRGGTVDESALIERLQSIPEFSAVLDVTQVEPLPTESPLWTLPNVLLTQHTAGGDLNEMRGSMQYFLDNLKRFRAGKPLKGIVDFQRGY